MRLSGKLDFVFRSQKNRNALMQLIGLNVQNSAPAIGGHATRLLNQQAHGIGLVHQA